MKDIMVMEENKVYCLYSNKEEEKLHAMAYSEEQVLEVSQYYSSGVWFVYSGRENSNIIENEKLYKKKITFSEQPVERPKYVQDKLKFSWVG